MRLTLTQVDMIRNRIRLQMGQQSRNWLFGSRADDSRRGGDVDLYVEPESMPGLADNFCCKGALAEALDLNVDLVIQQPGCDLPICRTAKQSGVLL